MIKILRADFLRLRRSFAFRLVLIGMLVLAAVFMVMQATSMDYTVPLSRVIFLPMSLYAIAMAAFVSAFVGTDYSDGFIRNKLLTVERRSSLVISQIIVCCVACVIVYVVVTVFSAVVGRFFFENDVEGTVFLLYFLLGLLMSIVLGCLYSVVTLLCGNKTQAVIWCMGLAFVMLFLSLHTNDQLVQTVYRNGVYNPHYLRGIRRVVYSVLHDLNPTGQAAQLSSWEVWHPARGFLFDILLIVVFALLGCGLFRRKDIN